MDLKKLSISSSLKKFKNLNIPNIFIRQAVQKNLKNIFNLNIGLEKISFNKQNGFVTIQLNNTKKTAIFLKKDKLIKILNSLFKKNIIKDIK